ncbi:recombinase family protein [Bacillus niameyensis]|uniref:recombinase family protein n=1 Tax=Bacillus niameyensis TaxID=1522308 RepID=UPI000785EA70|nr:recombinase family protein [Bacillus niameyensis]
MPRAIGYVRVSTDKQLDNTSIEKQKEEIEKYCKNNQLTLVHIYDEGAYSAENIRDRKEFKQMYSHVFDKDENIDYVVVFKSDRISRDNLDALYIYKRITQAEKNLICIADNIDTRDKNAKLLYQFMSLVAELERDMIKLRTSSGMEKNADKGNFNGGKVYGYNTENKELKLNPDEAKVIKYIFKKYAINQWGYRKIAANLNEQRIRTKNGRHWTITAIKTILNNRIYIGEIKWRGSYRKGNHTRIIDDNLWNQTQKVLQLKSYMPEKLHPGTYPLSGLIKCPECGAPMVQGNSSKKYKYYQCSRNKNSGKCACSSNLVVKEYAEQFVFNHFFHTLKSLNLTTLITNTTLADISSEVEPIEDKIKTMKKELKRLSKKKSDVISWRSDDVIDEVTFRQQMKDVQKEESELIQFLRTLEKQLEQRQKPDIGDSVAIAIEKLEMFFEIMSDEDKKRVLHSFIDSIHVTQGTTSKERTIKEVKFKFDLSHISHLNRTA